MAGITKIAQARVATNLDNERQELLEKVEELAEVSDNGQWHVTLLGGDTDFDVDFKVYNSEVRAFIEKELRGQLAKIDEQLRELGIEPDA